MESVLGWVAHFGYMGIFGLLMLGVVGLPIPDETLLMFAGYLIFRHELEPLPAFAAGFLGSICGITVSYALGRLLGPYLVTRLGRILHVKPAQLDQVRTWYERKGKYGLVISYFIPGIRHLAAYVAGSSQLPLPVFATFAYLGGLLWSSSFIGIGYVLGDEWEQMSASIHRYLLLGAGIAAVVIVISFILMRHRQRNNHAHAMQANANRSVCGTSSHIPGCNRTTDGG
jgi:membrane protein DedA with SNARE-associated domain